MRDSSRMSSVAWSSHVCDVSSLAAALCDAACVISALDCTLYDIFVWGC